MKTYWLYYGDLITAFVRCETPFEARCKAIDELDTLPGCNHLYPEMNPANIRRLICLSTPVEIS